MIYDDLHSRGLIEIDNYIVGNRFLKNAKIFETYFKKKKVEKHSQKTNKSV